METQDQVLEQDQVQTEIPETIEKTTEVSQDAKKYQNEISGLNRRNTELEKLLKERDSVLEDQKKATMKESERRDYELQQRENEIIAKEQEILRYSNREKATKYMTDNNLDLSLLDTLSLDNWEAAQAKLEIMRDVVDNVRIKTLENFKTSNGHTPAADGGTASRKPVSPEMLKTMSPEEKMQALKEGRVTGFGKL